jgi:hypothetical protein
MKAVQVIVSLSAYRTPILLTVKVSIISLQIEKWKCGYTLHLLFSRTRVNGTPMVGGRFNQSTSGRKGGAVRVGFSGCPYRRRKNRCGLPQGFARQR